MVDAVAVIPPEDITDEYIIEKGDFIFRIYQRMAASGHVHLSALRRGKVFPKSPSISPNGENYFKVRNYLLLTFYGTLFRLLSGPRP